MNNIGKNSFDIGYMDTLAAGDSPLHRLDPRAKVITTLAFIVLVVSFHKYAVLALLPFFIYPVALIASSGLPAGYLLKKVLIVSPFALLVGIFNPMIDKGTLIQIGAVNISGGWISFLSILLRFVLTVTAALVLVASTGFGAVCDSLIKFGVPRVFVTQLMFFHRYTFVLNDEAHRLIRARSFRTFDSRAMNVKTFVSLTGHLLLRTLDRAERIYCAMRSRGFDGRIRVIRKMDIGSREVLFTAGWLLLFILLRSFDLPSKAGALVTGIFQ
ncbi:MAG: cobalt ECF transporter T component CbiQ [Candidatus Omnitrophota bacterium]|nr:cobalt ECF transporter T component CbiQ [Candidatus Omnitrophota bacterium]